ncbi:MAG TPA: hypothetical protein VJL84_11270 [Kiloniellales bacterium]|nr:hypothetical protein [Kiloniellales bacterium]
MQVLRTLSAAALFAIAGAGASLACGMASFVDADPRALYATQISSVDGAIVTDESVTLTVTFDVASGGWTDPQLVPVTYFVQPWDGVYEIYAMAIPPEGVATDALVPMTATIEMPLIEGVTGWRIIADQGCVTLLLDGSMLPEGGDGCTVQSLTVS